MKIHLTTSCLFVVTAVATVSFITPTVFGQTPKSVETKPLIDDITAAKVDKLFEKWDKPDSPGCALGIVKDGRLIYKRGYGMANLDYNIPLSPKSVFDIKAISNQFTAMSILLLAKQGKLSLDDDIQKYFPEIPRYQSPITIRHLIHQTGGIRDLWDLTGLGGMGRRDVRLTPDDYLGLITRQKQLNHKPGEEFLYTDTGYFLLPLIVKRVSGKSLREFADENIFKPLGMTNTHFHDDRNLAVRNRVTAYQLRNGRFNVVAAADDPLTVVSGVYTSVEDLYLWDQNFSNNKLGGGPDLISEALSTGTLNNGEKEIYAFGLFVDMYKGLQRIHHKGGGNGFQSVVVRFPEQNFSVLCLCNSNLTVWGLANPVADIFLADQLMKVPDAVKENVAAAPVVVIPEKELASLTGLYFDLITKRFSRRFYLKDGKLMLEPNFNGGALLLIPLSQNRFKVVNGPGLPDFEVVFVRPISGGPLQVKEIGTPAAGRGTKTYDAVNSEIPTSSQLAEFTGKYLSDELPGATYTLRMKDGKLILQVRNGITVFSDRALVLEHAATDTKDNLLTPAFADAFFTFGDGAIVRFTRNERKGVSGFTITTLNTEPVRGLRFNKQ